MIWGASVSWPGGAGAVGRSPHAAFPRGRRVAAPILAGEGVTTAYGGLVAVSDLSFAVEPGEIFAIVGPNGAGKTTLFDVISGITSAVCGVIRFDGEEIQRARAFRVCQIGVARTFQTTTTFATQTVLANALVGSVFGHSG